MDQDRREATLLLARTCAGDSSATEQLSPLLYGELRRVARSLLGRERRNHTLQPTELVHAAYLRLIDESQLDDGDAQAAKSRFLGIAAMVMRRILVEHARGRAAVKRGGARERMELDDGNLALPAQDETLLDVDMALDKLKAINPDLARLAELRLFGGLSVREAAPVMDLSLTAAKESWALARAWLSRLLRPDVP